MIEMKDVSFCYAQSDTESLCGVNLSIADGECILLCGKSGCGKTTMTRLINGMIPDFYDGELKGEVLVNGINPISSPLHEISDMVGTVFQNPRTQFYTMNTTSEIAFGCENRGMEPDAIRKRVTQAAEDLGIQGLLDRNIFQLSGGEKQKIAFASIYAVNPEVYVLDEPSSNLDCFAIRELRSILELLKAQGRTVILAEHRTWYLEGLVDRAVYMEQGKIVREYSMQELKRFTMEERIETGIRPVSLSDYPLSEKKSVKSDKYLSVQDLRFAYKKETALQIPDAKFQAGNITAIIGKNGAGKSTFVSALSGIFKKQKGTVCMDGKRQKPKERVAVSYMVMQEVNHQLFTDSVEEEIVLGTQGLSADRLEHILEQMDIADLKERHPMTLSGGQKQRVAIAAAVFRGKKILIFDEPTSGLDFSHMMQTVILLQKLKSPDTYIFVITHDYEFILSACDEVVQIEMGCIKEKYSLNIKSLKKLRDFYQIN